MKAKILSTLSGLLILTNGYSQWNIDPSINTPVSTAINNQNNCVIVTDSKKGAIMVWEDHRNNTVSSDVYSQRLNSAGLPMWTTNGVAICTDTAAQSNIVAIDAGNGSAIFAWQDLRNGNKDIYAQKIDSSGNVLWTANGVAVCTKALDQKKPTITSDTKGGAIIVWEDSVSSGTWDVYANRINANGTVMWGTSGVAVCNSTNKQSNTKVRQDTKGGAIIGWQDFRNGLEYYVYAQRLDSNGVAQWTANGVKACTTGGGQTSPKLREDGNGGIFIGWQDMRSGSYDVYAQRISSNGTLLWAAAGVPVCSYLGNQSALDMATDGINGAVISWKDDRSGILQIYANRISPSGALQWGQYGLLIATGLNPNGVGDNSGGVILTWQDSVSAGGTWNVYAQRIDSLGTKLWLSTGAPVAIANGGQSSPKQVSTGDGGAIFCWQDKRSTVDLDIYAHKIFPNGLSTSSSVELNYGNIGMSCYPNPFENQTVIKINTTERINSWQLNVYNEEGKLVHLEKISNSNELLFDKKNLGCGIYFYQATFKDNEIIGTGKFIISK